MHRHLARIAAASLMIAALSACAGEGPSIRLAEPETLSAPTGVGATPMFALSPSGRRTVAWVSAPDGGTDGRLNVASEGALGELRDSLGGIEPHGEAPPKLGYGPDGTLFALYVVAKLVPGHRFPYSTLRLASSVDDGRTWGAPRTVLGDSIPGSRNFHALHVGGDGTLYVAWLESRDGGKSATYLTRSRDGGSTWTPPSRVGPDESCPCCRTAIATGAQGELYVAWRTVMPGNVRDIVVARSGDGGATWNAPKRVHADDFVFEGCPHAGPSMQVDAAGRLHVAWWTGKEGSAGVWHARSDDGAATFKPAIALGIAEASRPAHAQLAVEGDSTVLVAWDDGTLAIPRVMLRASRDGGDSFAAAIAISNADRVASFPVLALTRGTATIAWSELGTTEHAHAAAAAPNMRDPKVTMPLLSVGASRVMARTAKLGG